MAVQRQRRQDKRVIHAGKSSTEHQSRRKMTSRSKRNDETRESDRSPFLHKFFFVIYNIVETKLLK